MTNNLRQVLDLSIIQKLGQKWDYIISLEVGEHTQTI